MTCETYDQDQASIIFRTIRLALAITGLLVLLTVNRLTAWDNTGMLEYYGALLPLFSMPEWTVMTICIIIFAILAFLEVMVLIIQVHDYLEMRDYLKRQEKATNVQN